MPRRALTLLGSMLGALLLSAPVQAKSQLVQLTVEGEKIAALYWTPAKPASPGVILLHMLNRSKEDWTPFGDYLQKNGYAAIAIDLRGRGLNSTARLVADARAAYDFLRAQNEVNTKRIAVVGASIGANAALNFASAEPAIRCAGLLSPGLDYRGVKSEDAIRRYGSRPLLIVASSEDPPAMEAVRRLPALASKPPVVKIYTDAGHGTYIFAKPVGLEQEILWFLRANL